MTAQDFSFLGFSSIEKTDDEEAYGRTMALNDRQAAVMIAEI
jgi:hypothetical protein